jgi:hypothetical protein
MLLDDTDNIDVIDVIDVIRIWIFFKDTLTFPDQVYMKKIIASINL